MDILLFGDSISAYMHGNFDIDEHHKREKNPSTSESSDLKLYRAGYENATTEMIRDYCYPHLNFDLYDIVVLECGINDFLRPRYDEDCKKQTPQEIADGIINFAKTIKTEKNKKLIVQGLYPVTPKPYAKDYFKNLVGDIKQVNTCIKKYCKENNVPYMDMYSVLKNEAGEMNNKFSDDGIHPNEKGYQKVYETLSSIIASEFSNEPASSFE